MSQRFVADASIGVAWVHPAQATPQTEAMLQAVYDGAVVEAPALWPLEVANALLVLVRRNKLSAAERQRSLIALQNLSLELDHEMSSLAFSKLSKLAEEQRLSVYDAAYLELALRKKLPLGCKDGPLRQAAKRCHLKSL
jgi:predicted nucleic acid-binding protein